MEESRQTQHFPQLIPYRTLDKWGYSNREKQMVIPAIYDQTFRFIGQIARVKLKGKYGLITADGKEFLPPIYDEIEDFSTGYFLNEDGSCSIFKDGKYGLVSCYGKILVDANCDSPEEAVIIAAKLGWNGCVPHTFHPSIPLETIKNIEVIGAYADGVAPFRKDNRWGLITEEGKILIEPKYDNIPGKENESWPFLHAEKWGILDNTGNAIVDAQFDGSRGFSNGQAACQEAGLWGAIDLSGNWVIEPQYSELGEFRDGLSAAQKDGLYGFINETGEVVIDFQFQEVLDFYDGACAIFEEDMIYFIDKSGKTISEKYLRYAGPNKDFLMHVMKDEKWGIVKPNGDFLLPIEYDLPKAMGQVVHMIEDGMIPIKKGPLLGYANSKGEVVVEPKYVTIDPFCEGLSRVSILDPKYSMGKTPESMEAAGDISGVFNFGFIDKSGKEVIPLQYTSAQRFEFGLVFVNTIDTETGYITYDGAEYFDDNQK